MATTLLLSFLIIVFLGIPVAFSLGIGSLIAIIKNTSMSLLILPQRLATGTDSFVLLCIPFFILAGEIMNTGGLGARLYKFCNTLVGHFRGGLAQVNVLQSMIFAGITGAAAADSAVEGPIAIPAMVSEGYDKDFSCAITASSSPIGVIIPPSIPMVLYGSITGISVVKLFAAGFIPGIMVGIAEMIVCYYISVKRGYPKKKRASFGEMLIATKDGLIPLGIPLIILGGVLGGVFTPTEAGVIAVLYSLIISIFIYKSLAIKDLGTILVRAAESTAVVMLIVSAASLYAWFITYANIPLQLGNFLISLNLGKFGIFLFIIFVYLIAGALMDMGANIIMLTPIFYPIILKAGIDPIQFGLVTIVVLAVGLVTPPVCVCTYICANIGGIAPEKVVKASIPFLVAIVIVAILMIVFPSLTTFLPSILVN